LCWTTANLLCLTPDVHRVYAAAGKSLCFKQGANLQDCNTCHRGHRGAETAAVAELAGSAAGPRKRALSPEDECGAML